MPLPNPNSDEKQANFISRCMSNSNMKKEFPDQKKRTDVCFNQWKKGKGGENMKSDKEIKRDEKGRQIIAENVSIIFNASIGETE